jgi:hypothetical protein
MNKFLVILALVLGTCYTMEGVVELTDSNFKETVYS